MGWENLEELAKMSPLDWTFHFVPLLSIPELSNSSGLSSLTTFSPVQAPVLVAQSCLFATSWTVARQAPLSMELSSQDYWSVCHSLLQGIFPTQGVKQTFIENLFLLGTVISLI